MRAAIFERPGVITVREVPDPQCDPDGLIVRVTVCGLCGSDVRNFRSGLRTGATGQIIGHEIAGVVDSVGSDCSGFRPGDRVAVAPDVSCGRCPYCAAGLVNLCLEHRMLGTHWPGGFAQYIALPAVVLRRGMVHPTPGDLEDRYAALSEPLASVLAAQERAAVGPGQAVAVFGDGPIGCMHLEIARARGAAPVILVGRRRLGLAAVFRPDAALPSGPEVPALVRERTQGLGADVAIVATPAAESLVLALACVRKRGTVVLFGGLPRDSPCVALDANRIHYDEVRLQGAFSYPSVMHREALRALNEGRISAALYVSRTVPLEGIVDAIHASERAETLKVLIAPWAQGQARGQR